MGCLTPIRIKAKQKIKDGNWAGVVKEDGYSVVPCGKCPECKKKRANAWIFRLLKEERIHLNSYFVTLTYDNNNVPISKNGYMTLKKRDVQLFMKRLRKISKCKTTKYYLCGEYGSDSWRPHYHAIMFDVRPSDIEKAWGLGYVDIGYDCKAEAIAYTTKYICKDKRVPAHAKDDRLPEFAVMSKNLGKNYLTPQVITWHRENKASYVVKEGGYTAPLPRYYRDFIFNEAQREEINQLNQEKYQALLHQAINDAGSQKEFYRVQFDHIKEVLRNNNQKTKRNKI